jgi:hypothetical protein
MKQKDMVIMGGVAIVAALFSIVLSGVIFGSPKKNPIKVPVVHKISSTFPTTQTDDYKAFLNDKALNPTELIQIGNGDNNKQPFQNANR